MKSHAFSHPHKLPLLCKVLFLYSFKYKCLFKFLEKKLKNLLQTWRLSVTACIQEDLTTVSSQCIENTF